MPIDLFRDDLVHVAGSVLYDSINAFTRTSEPEEVRPRESYLLDYKESWGDRAIQTVDAFAHTFGGILIVGVSEKGGLPQLLVGVDSKGELKTSIASSIATNISPTPLYEIAECSLPNEPSKKLAVVRVRKGNELYYYTKKGERHPIYVRNEDESVPADGAQLRALIHQRMQGSEAEPNLVSRIDSLHRTLYLQKSPAQNLGLISATSFHVLLIPHTHPKLRLDSALENQFRNFIRQVYRFIQFSVLKEEENRYQEWYRYGLFQNADEYQNLWEVTSAGDIGFATQVRFAYGQKASWSLGDRVFDLIASLRIATAFWGISNYYGDARLIAYLEVGGLSLYRQDFTPAFPLTYKLGLSLDASGVEIAKQSWTSASGTLDVNFATLTSELPETIAHILNQLLRSMQHSANLQILKASVSNLLHSIPE